MEQEIANTSILFAEWIIKNGYVPAEIHTTHTCWKKPHETLLNLMLPEGTTEDLYKKFIKTQ